MEIPPESVSLDPVKAQLELRVAPMRGPQTEAGQIPHRPDRSGDYLSE